MSDIASSPVAGLVRRSRRALRLTGEPELVRLVRAGDDAAFEAIYDRHHRGILSFCRHMLGSREEAEDAVQHTFAAAYRDLASSDKPIQLRAWLYTIARNRCLSILRARRDERSLEDVPEPSVEGLSSAVLRRQDLRDLLRDLQRLPDDQRAALVLAELGALSHDEIAAALGVRRDKVKALVFQAREALGAARRARESDCREIREQLAVLRGGALRRTTLRRHVEACPSCAAFGAQVRRQRSAMRAVLPVVPTLALREAALTGALGAAAGGVAGGGGAAGGGLLAAAASKALATKALAVAAVAGGAAGGAVVAVDAVRGGADGVRPRVATAGAVEGAHAPARRGEEPVRLGDLRSADGRAMGGAAAPAPAPARAPSPRQDAGPARGAVAGRTAAGERRSQGPAAGPPRGGDPHRGAVDGRRSADPAPAGHRARHGRPHGPPGPGSKRRAAKDLGPAAPGVGRRGARPGREPGRVRGGGPGRPGTKRSGDRGHAGRPGGGRGSTAGGRGHDAPGPGSPGGQGASGRSGPGHGRRGPRPEGTGGRQGRDAPAAPALPDGGRQPARTADGRHRAGEDPRRSAESGGGRAGRHHGRSGPAGDGRAPDVDAGRRGADGHDASPGSSRGP